MSKEFKPICRKELIGKNVFEVISEVKKALREEKMDLEEEAMTMQVLASNSYEESIKVMKQYVEFR